MVDDGGRLLAAGRAHRGSGTASRGRRRRSWPGRRRPRCDRAGHGSRRSGLPGRPLRAGASSGRLQRLRGRGVASKKRRVGQASGSRNDRCSAVRRRDESQSGEDALFLQASVGPTSVTTDPASPLHRPGNATPTPRHCRARPRSGRRPVVLRDSSRGPASGSRTRSPFTLLHGGDCDLDRARSSSLLNHLCLGEEAIRCESSVEGLDDPTCGGGGRSAGSQPPPPVDGGATPGSDLASHLLGRGLRSPSAPRRVVLRANTQSRWAEGSGSTTSGDIYARDDYSSGPTVVPLVEDAACAP